MTSYDNWKARNPADELLGPEPEPPRRTLDEIRRTPVGLLTDDEISQLDPAGQAFARGWLGQRAREESCPAHERISTATREQANRGWHRGRCKHCGADMTYDSGD